MKKSDLAQLYMPYHQVKSAVNRLMAWINGSPQLVAALTATGYHSRQRNLTPQQVQLIYRYIGEPM